MNRPGRLLLVVGCVVGLLAVASSLPAADPRLDNPAASDGSGEVSAGDWKSVAGPADRTTPEDESDAETATPATPDPAPGDPDVEVEGTLVPRNEVTVQVDDVGRDGGIPVAVDGEVVGTTGDFRGVDVRVPDAEEMTVSLPDHGVSRTFDVRTTATILTHDAAIPGRSTTLEVSVAGTSLSDATVYRDGEAVATTNGSGQATVGLPETAGPVEFRVERRPVDGARTVTVDEPTVRFTSPLLFPGFPAPVQVSAGGEGVPNATVAVEGGGTVVTDENGRATVRLPVDDEARLRVEIGAESATASVENLYLRLTALVVLAPGFVVGAVWTYFRYVPARYRYRRVALLAAFVALADWVGGLIDRLGTPSAPGWTVELPTFDRVGFHSVSWPSLRLSFPRFGGLGLGGLLGALGSGGSSGGLRSTIGDWLGRSDGRHEATVDEPATDDGAAGADGPSQPRGPRAEIRRAWHAFVDRLGVENRTTATPGAIARGALDAGFPAESVRTLVRTFRDVEYGDREVSTDRVAAARAAAEDLLAHGPDEEGSE